MSLRELAKKHLAKTACPTLSQPGQYRGVPAGQNSSSPYSSKGSAVPRSVPGGTANRDAETVCPAGTVREGGTNGTNGTPGTVGTNGTVGTRLAPIPAPVSLEDRRASVEAIYAQMEVERERRRDWYAQPIEGWHDGRLTLHNIARDETVVVDFRKWRSGR